MLKNLLLLFLISFTVTAYGQATDTESALSTITNRKGRLFLYYGWNRSVYSHSDIHFKGTGYHFTLNQVVAHDRPTPFDPVVYLNPVTMTIPQYQYRLGYYISDKYAVSFGFNHMKYVMDTDQIVKISGTISTPEAGIYNGTYHDQDIKMTPDFLKFEHTNGLNYLDFNFDRTETLWISKGQRVSLSIIAGVGAGIMYPKSMVKLFGEKKDRWHLAGYGLSSHMALRLEFLKNMFIQVQAEGGFINMVDIVTTKDPSARAKQNFFYAEETVMIGSDIRKRKKK